MSNINELATAYRKALEDAEAAKKKHADIMEQLWISHAAEMEAYENTKKQQKEAEKALRTALDDLDDVDEYEFAGERNYRELEATDSDVIAWIVANAPGLATALLKLESKKALNVFGELGDDSPFEIGTRRTITISKSKLPKVDSE